MPPISTALGVGRDHHHRTVRNLVAPTIWPLSRAIVVNGTASARSRSSTRAPIAVRAALLRRGHRRQPVGRAVDGRCADESRSVVDRHWHEWHADRWDEFRASWKWSQLLPYATERRPGLWGCFDLMDAKQRFDTYSKSRKRSYRGGARLRTEIPVLPTKRLREEEKNPIRLTQTATLLHGDVTHMMRLQIATGSIDLAIADVPYFMRSPGQTTVTVSDQRDGKKPLFNEEWDRFASMEDYELFCAAWIDEAIRCLNIRGLCSSLVHITISAS